MDTRGTPLISTEEHARLRATIDRHAAWVETIRDRHGWVSYCAEEVPEDCRVTNVERSLVEVYEFVNDPPERYFAYVRGYIPHFMRFGSPPAAGELTTFTGDLLGAVTFGRRYTLPNNGSVRVPIRVRAINGREYFGTYFKSSGDYARIRACKGRKG